MSDPTTPDGGNGSGCAIIIGLVIVALALGSIYGSATGWLIFGGTLLVLGLLSS